MSLEQISMRVDSKLLNELDQIAKSEFKRRSDVVRDALVAHVKQEMNGVHPFQRTTSVKSSVKCRIDLFKSVYDI